MNAKFLQDRITATESLIVKIEAAIDFVITNPTKKYEFDTGQTRQSVTRHDLDMLQNLLDNQMNRLATLCSRAYGSSTHSGGLAW